MQQLLPIVIRSIITKDVRYTISRMCFFYAICAKSFSVSELDALQEDIVMTLCNLEKYFSSSFYTIMVHLVVHLVREVKLCGPLYLRWMYSFERYMKVLKSYVCNRNRSEGFIVEAQICEEVVEFCSEFLFGLDPIGLGSLNSRKDKQTDRSLSAGTYVQLDIQQLKQAHLHTLSSKHSYDHTPPPLIYPSQYIIFICDLFCRRYMNHLKMKNPRRAKKNNGYMLNIIDHSMHEYEIRSITT
ncbi:hypothetical protein IC582_014633 [Cucumis melo]